ncbi:two-partner secretion domain-containing protein, partial [Sphaerotilus montanus]|uniref:two-partner secretion domain-containing protein n=1 Tax=Sphaerotilus montanus TaxID=522889 RepID=UPI003FA1B52F
MASLNHSYRLVWSARLGTWMAVAECTAARGKGGRRGVPARLALIVLAAAGLGGGAAWAGGLPQGGQVVQGSGTLSQSASTLTVNQASSKLVTNWQSFSIGAGQTVQFVQPSTSSVALNRVLGSDVSTIQGSLRANGQVFLLNPNGVLFTPTARVDTAGLIASTLGMSDGDFLAGRYRLQGASTASVENQGSLRVDGGGVALVAATVRNIGEIQADSGFVGLGSGQDVTVDFGGTVKLQVNQGALDSLIENGGAVRADGGQVLFTAKAAGSLSRSVINQTGVVQARTLASGAAGEILLLGDMTQGTLNAGGVLDASAPVAGPGGKIETSAAVVSTAPGLTVDAGSAHGQGGTWVIDPYDYTINSTAAANIGTALNTGTSVTVMTQSNVASYGSAGASSGNGDITVASAITKSAGGDATLTLQADRNIAINSPITSTSGALGITLSAANNAAGSLGGVNVGANLVSNGGRILIGGAGGNQTTARSYGIGYALNSASSAPAVQIGTNVSITSGGGDITINGQTSAANSGSYSAVKGGLYLLSGATLDSGGGNLYLSGISTGGDKVFGFGVEANSGTTTTFRTSASSGVMVVDAQNTANPLGALGLVNNGNQARVQFWAPSVAHMLFRINGNNKATTFTISPPCQSAYPNCGTMVIPGGNQSYTSASYNVVNMAMVPLYVFSGTASRTYDGLTDTAGLTYSALNGPTGFSVANLGTLAFSTPSKNVGTYSSLVPGASNPANYSSGGTTYAVAYFNQGTYTVTPKTVSNFTAGNKVYDGTTAARVTSSDLIVGDAVTVNATGGFAQSNVGNGVTVNVTGVGISGADAGNYTVTGGGSISTTANITPAPLTVTANDASKTYDGQGYSGGNGVGYSGFVNGETAAVLSGTPSFGGTSQGAVNAGTYAITPGGLSAGNYALSYQSGTLTVDPATLTVTANTAARTYGAANPGLGASVSGFVNGETLASATTGTLTLATAATASSPVGSYAITGSGLSANHGNYTVVQAAGNSAALSVTPAPLTVTANDASKTYDGQGY